MEPKIIPIYHASFILDWGGKIIYVDPAWDKSYYQDKPKPELVLITDIHFDHLDNYVLESLSKKGYFDLIVPQAVYNQLLEKLKSKAKILSNGEEINWNDFKISALPMYNTTSERLQFHPKGRGNGYLIEKDNFRVYIAGDTEDIPEMRKLKNIDVAFIPMNLPYTMTIEQAASAVLEFQPKKVYPYHYRGEAGFSDVEKFKELVEKENKNIKVVLAKWY
ncbi:MAG: metal-dependent hydrolase [Candidatus Parcubacteria bacterium]|nr:MAG: metal-dependent hydrolase [Candidatus Parcubacteria bacterium]